MLSFQRSVLPRIEPSTARRLSSSGPSDRTSDLHGVVPGHGLRQDGGRVHCMLVHSAALMTHSLVEESSVEHFSQLLNVNVLAPFALTKHLLPEICASKGQIVFVNSSIVNNAAAGTVMYAATKHALKGLADGLRQELNIRGVRVISIYPGRTATPLQASVLAAEGRQYRPEILLQPEEVAAMVRTCFARYSESNGHHDPPCDQVVKFRTENPVSTLSPSRTENTICSFIIFGNYP